MLGECVAVLRPVHFAAAAGVVTLLLLVGPAVGATIIPAANSGRAVGPNALPPAPLKFVNAAGYYLVGSAHSITDVKGSWIVAKVSTACRSGHASSFMEQVIGVDGIKTTDYGYLGTFGGCVTYGAWFEFYPTKSPTVINMTIRAGDYMSAEIFYHRGQFHLTLKDLNTSKSFSKVLPGLAAARIQALWAVTLISTASTELAPFGTAKFGWDFTGVKSTNTANVSGSVTSIGGFAAHGRFWMYDSTYTIVRAEALALTSNGLSFAVLWKHY